MSAGSARKTIAYGDNLKILAPMVRVGTLPTRLVALDYGADLVYSEELIDYKFLKARRIRNAVLDTVDYKLPGKGGEVLFRTCAKEKDRVVLQIGTADPERAAKVAQMVVEDVAAVDVNMGCPKAFSIKGGMGASLLTRPEKATAIMKRVVEQVGDRIPVTCKIRLLPRMEDTIKLVKQLEATGISALGVHGRLREERPRDPCRPDEIRQVAEALSIPVIANGGSGDITSYADIRQFGEATGAQSVMVARAAQWNPSVFRAEGPEKLPTVIRAYLRYALQYDNVWENSKFCLMTMIMHRDNETEEALRLRSAKGHGEITAIWGLEEEYNRVVASQEEKRKRLILMGKAAGDDEEGVAIKRDIAQMLDDEREIEVEVVGGNKKRKITHSEQEVLFDRERYSVEFNPKACLEIMYRRHGLGVPVYEVDERVHDRQFKGYVSINDCIFTNSRWSKNKKMAEQSAALAALRYLQLEEKQDNKQRIFYDWKTSVIPDDLKPILRRRATNTTTNSTAANESENRVSEA